MPSDNLRLCTQKEIDSIILISGDSYWVKDLMYRHYTVNDMDQSKDSCQLVLILFIRNFYKYEDGAC